MKLPSELHALFWHCNAEELDTETAKTQIILEVLARGSLHQIKLLCRIYDFNTVGRLFRADVKGNRTLPAPVVYLFSGLYLTAQEFEEYRAWHRHPVRKWEQRRIVL